MGRLRISVRVHTLVAIIYTLWIHTDLNFRNTTRSYVIAVSTSPTDESITTQNTTGTTATSGSTETTTYLDTMSTVPMENNSEPAASSGTTETTTSLNSTYAEITESTSEPVVTIMSNVTVSPTTIHSLSICQSAYYCSWPWPNAGGGDISTCACPAGYLNLDNNCCLTQNWIIGLSVGFGGFLILVLSGLIAYTCCCQDRKDKAEEKRILKDYEESVAKDQDVNSVIHVNGLEERTVVVHGDERRIESPVVATSEITHVEELGHPSLEVAHPAAPQVVQPQHVHVMEEQTATVKLEHQNTNPVQRVSSKAKQQPPQQRHTDYIETSQLYTNFTPRLDIVDPEKDYSIRRPHLDSEPAFKQII